MYSLQVDELVVIALGELSTNEIKQIFKEAVSLGCMAVRFTGGEPLLREDFEDLYIFARKQGLRVLLFTNATLIAPQLTALFSRISPLEKVEVSMYEMKKESYEAVTRTAGSFQAAWRGIHLLLKHKIPFVVKGALLPANKEEIDEFESWAAMIPLMARPPVQAMFFDLCCRREKDKNQLIKNLRVSPEEGLQVMTRRKEEYAKEMMRFCGGFIGPKGDRFLSCGAGVGRGSVDAYGFFSALPPASSSFCGL